MAQTTQSNFLIAVDAGGTQLRAASFACGSTKPNKIRRIHTQAADTSPTERLIHLISTVWPDAGNVKVIALAVPGAVNPHEGIIYTSPNIKGWMDLPLQKIISDQFHVPAAIGNDANLAALGEWKFALGQDYRNLVYFTISTGIGGGVIEDGRLVLGQRGLAGEVGHITVDPEGPMCSCGQRGHLEAIASGPAIVRWVKSEIAGGADSILKNQTRLTAEHIYQAAVKGDSLSKKAFSRAGYWFGRSLADFLHLFNPDVAIIGGGVSRSGDFFLTPMLDSMKKHAISPRYYEHLTVTTASLGDDSGLMGALALAQSLE